MQAHRLIQILGHRGLRNLRESFPSRRLIHLIYINRQPSSSGWIAVQSIATGRTGDMRFFKTICWMCAFLGVLHISIPARSQSSDTNSQAPGSVPAQPPTSAASPVPGQPALKPAELDALVAPIALYPDGLLANVLMASTYPLEVVRAERWMNRNKNLKNDALKTAARSRLGMQASRHWWRRPRFCR
jgi:Protein of unknown function (DUF3300)